MATTIDELKTSANLVANATEVGENTAGRVGGALQQAADLISQLLTKATDLANTNGSQDDKITELTNTLNSVKSSLQTAIDAVKSDLATETTNRGSKDDSLQASITAMQNQLDTLVSGNASTAIESFNEVITFLSGVTDSETLTALLNDLQGKITTLQSTLSEDVTMLQDADKTTNEKVEAALNGLDTQSGQINAMILDNYRHHTALFYGIEDEVITTEPYSPAAFKLGDIVVYGSASKQFYLLRDGKYYISWYDMNEYYEKTDAGFNVHNEKVYIDKTTNVPYYYKSEEGLVAIAPKDTPASIFNATTEVPISGYYVLCDTDNTGLSAVHAAWNAKKAVSGLILSFEISAGIWKTYQYVGKSVTETNWLNTDNWKDFGSLAAGSEQVLVIDNLPQQNKVGDYYTLETAIASLIYCQTKTGVTYAKKGLIISYSIAANQMETKQFQGELNDFSEVGLWKDFGGGGKVETKDEPAKDGTDALSTGGAYKVIPTTLSVDTETEGVVKMQMKNAAGDTVGDEVQFSVGTGSGGSSGTIVSINFEKSPLYVKAGGTVKLNASIMAVQSLKTGDVLNNIERLELIDRDTAQTIETLNVNKASSASATTYDFSVDVSSYFTAATAKRYKLVAYDDAGNSGSRNINVTAVDVTITSVQTLNYTANTVLQMGGSVKALQMYKFANNASDKGILATTEIYLNGKWQVLGTATVMDTYSHSVSINPTDVLGGGEKLTHGAYPLRIHGEDIGSRVNEAVGTGVIGNYLHTTLMVVEDGNTTPIVATRWYTEDVDGVAKLYQTISVEFAVYDSSTTEPTATVYINGTEEAERVAYRSQTYTFTKKVTDVKYDGTVTLAVIVKSGTGASQEADFLVSGTMIDVEEVKTQRQFSLDFSNRSNNESTHTIADNGVTMDVSGVNWSTNGFVKDNFGTDKADGDMALRLAENAKATLHYQPFNDASIEQNGMAIQFVVMKKNVADDSTRLMSCIQDGFGFYVNGQNVVFTFDNGATVAHTITAALDDNTRTNVCIVIEPAAIAPYTGIGVAKMYFDGEEMGACYYNAGSIVAHTKEITFDGTLGDFYLYNIKAWRTYFGFEQEFDNYLLTMTDTDAMIEEYDFNKVMSSQTAENTTKNRPQAQALYNIGIPYFVVCKNPDTADNDAKDNYPEYLEGLDGDKKTKRYYDIYAYFPNRPWQDFKATNVETTNQGTTSSKRPIKNIKMKFKKATITLLHTEADFTGTDLEKFKECEANAAKHKLQILDNSLPTNIVTVKVDYSESGGANNGASTNLYNDLQRELGADYVTPAQLAYNGTTKYVINSSICSIPCAFFRTDRYSPDATSPSYGYFHAKGNWNEDKGDAKVFGFEGVAGYNKECLNYGDFYELVAAKGQTLSDFAAAQDKSKWVFYSDAAKTETYDVVVLSEFCGPNHMVFRKQDDGSWKETTGTMTFDGSKWVISGDVVNPVENYELLKYDALDWFQGVNSVDDMMTADTDGNPIWMQYFESRYPDDDNLTALYEAGLKVPYNLYNWLKFCQDCNQHLTENDGTIVLGGKSVPGTAANRLKKWQQELHTVANVHSILCYHIFTDYIAAVDQRSKNMMVGFYLDRDGVTRMYLNHLYDGDTIVGSDNDCGLTVPALLDPNDDEGGIYQGHDSVLFVQNYNVGDGGFWLNDDGSSTVTMKDVAAAMRNLTTSDGLRPFSYDGIVKYWITDRLSKWPKVVSSFDGERKYIEHSKSTANYFYALHGLSIQRLKDFVKTRFLYRDGFYQTGDLYSSVVSMRVTGKSVQIKITAAKDGYFGVGVDRANVATDSCYLKSGESYTLNTGMTNTGSGTMLYVFGAERLEKLDISGCTPSPASWDISALVLIKELIIGGASYTLTNNNEGYLSNLQLGNLPYLETLDIRNTAITTVNAKYCPRLKKVQAEGSKLTKIDLAEAGMIESLSLPSTYKNLILRYLPKLVNSGITLEDAKSVETLEVTGCDNIDAWTLLMLCAGASRSGLKYVRVTGLNVRGNGDDLVTLIALSLKGLDATGAVQDEPAIMGVYHLTKYTDDDTIATWQTALPELTIQQQIYTDFMEDDLETDPENVTNLDNSTGYKFSNTFVPSGHVLKIRKKSVPVKGKFNSTTKKIKMTAMGLTDYTKFADGSDFDNKDTLGEGFDCFMYIPKFYYKGINDFKNQQKHTLLSSLMSEPEPTYTKKNQPKLSEILFADAKGVPVASFTKGTTFSADNLTTLSSCAVYRLDVEGMKQCRYPTVNNASYGSTFVGSDGVVIQSDTLAVTGTADSPLDFSAEQGDYVYRDVPDGAKWLYFTCNRGLSDDVMVRAVDSSDIEALEDWVEHKSTLIGIYGGSIDDLGYMRSISGRKTRIGDGTNTTYAGWKYDSDGNPTEMPVSATLHYTYQDLLNLCILRGKGYHATDYEQGKIIAMLSKCYYGNRDDQRIYGFGTNPQYTTGTKDSTGMKDTVYGTDSGVNKIWGLEGFVGCNWEVMDNIGCNIATFLSWKASKRAKNNENDPVDGVYHIYDPKTGTERTVQGLMTQATAWPGLDIARVKHGRFCDTLVSSQNTDNSKWSTCYAACSYMIHSKGRVVGRAGNSAYAHGGLVFSHAFVDSASSSSSSGVRLAFDGELENESEIDSEVE